MLKFNTIYLILFIYYQSKYRQSLQINKKTLFFTIYKLKIQGTKQTQFLKNNTMNISKQTQENSALFKNENIFENSFNKKSMNENIIRCSFQNNQCKLTINDKTFYLLTKYTDKSQIILKQIDEKIFTDLFENKMFLSNTDKKSTIKRNIPFILNPAQLISTSPTSRIYQCEYKNISLQEDILQTELLIKDSFDKTYPIKDNDENILRLQKHIITNQIFTQLYYKIAYQMSQDNNLTTKTTYHSVISPLKCKVINLKDYKQHQIAYVMDYLQNLRFFYQYRDVIHSQSLLISENRKIEKQKLKLFYFDFNHMMAYPINGIKTIVEYLQKEPTPNNQQSKSQQQQQQVNAQAAVLSILNYLGDQNWQVKNKAVNIIQKAINKNSALIKEYFIDKLWEMLTYKQSAQKNVIRLLKICLIKLVAPIKSFPLNSLPQKQLKNLTFKTCQALTGHQKSIKNSKNQNITIDFGFSQQFRQSDQQLSQQFSQQIKSEFIKAYLQKYSDQLKEISESYNNKKDKQITVNELSQLLTQNFITNVIFSSSLNTDLNQQLQTYQQFANKQKIESTLYEERYMYFISEYHHGRSLKEMILSNWKGFEDLNVVHKLFTKLFWAYAQLQYCGFYNHFPTLQNIIVNGSVTNPDLSINMGSFINFTFLFQKSRFSKNERFLTEQNLTQKINKSTLEQYLPFFYSHQNKTYKINKIDKVKNLLCILLFIICRRLDHFSGLQSAAKQLKIIIQKNTLQTKKLDKQSREKSDKQKQIKMQQKINTKQRQTQKPTIFDKQRSQNQRLKENIYNSVNSLQAINSNLSTEQIDKGHFIRIVSYVPQFYSTFLKKYELPSKDVKQYEMLSYKNSNNYRINQFQNHLGLQKNRLLNIFQDNLTELNGQKRETNDKRLTWKDLFGLIFLRGSQKSVRQSKLLKFLGDFFNYPMKNQSQQLPAEIYFALKFDIDFCYLQQKYDGKWFECFDTQSEEERLKYDMQTICLLKNIKSEVIKIANKKVEKIIEILQKGKRISMKNEKESLNQSNQAICSTLKAGINLLKYLNLYEKKVYIKEIKNPETKIISPTKLKQTISQKKLQFLTTDYFESFLQEDIKQLEEVYQLFMQKIKQNEHSMQKINVNEKQNIIYEQIDRNLLE